MQGFEFIDYLENFPFLKNHFAGIFPIDKLPKSIKVRHFCICNTDKSSGSGRHWFCLLKTSKSCLECFDSLGIDSNKQKVLEIVCKFRGIKTLQYNETPFQSPNSNTCGLFTLYFIIERMHNLDMEFSDLLYELFDADDQESNEKKIQHFYETVIKDN